MEFIFHDFFIYKMKFLFHGFKFLFRRAYFPPTRTEFCAICTNPVNIPLLYLCNLHKLLNFSNYLKKTVDNGFRWVYNKVKLSDKNSDGGRLNTCRVIYLFKNPTIKRVVLSKTEKTIIILLLKWRFLT